MRGSEFGRGFDAVRAAVERVRAGRSTVEESDLPSGEKVLIQRDSTMAAGVRIDTPNESAEAEPVVLPGLRERRGASSPEADPGRCRSQAFGPSETRGTEYPKDLPFLPDSAASISIMESEGGGVVARNAAWISPADPLRALGEVKTQLREGGWEEGEATQASSYMGQTYSSTFKKGRILRTVALMAFGDNCQIMLFEKDLD